MTYQKLLSYTRKAVDEFHMIEDGRFYRHRRFRREGQPKPRIGIEGLTALLSEEI